MPTPVLGISRQQQGTGTGTILPIDPSRALQLAEFKNKIAQQKAAEKAGFFKTLQSGIGEWSRMKDAEFTSRVNQLFDEGADLYSALGENPFNSTSPSAIDFQKRMAKAANDAKKSMDIEKYVVEQQALYQEDPEAWENPEEVLGYIWATPFDKVLNNPLPRLKLKDPGAPIWDTQSTIIQQARATKGEGKALTENDFINILRVAAQDGTKNFRKYFTGIEQTFNGLSPELQQVFKNKAKALGLGDGKLAFALESTKAQAGMQDLSALDIMMEVVKPFKPVMRGSGSESDSGVTIRKNWTEYDRNAIMASAVQYMEAFPSVMSNDPNFDPTKTVKQNANIIASAYYDEAMATKEQQNSRVQGREGGPGSGKPDPEAIIQSKFPIWYEKFKSGDIEAASFLFGDEITSGPQDVRVEENKLIYTVRNPLVQYDDVSMTPEQIMAKEKEIAATEGEEAARMWKMDMMYLQRNSKAGASRRMKEDGTFELVFDLSKLTKNQALNLFRNRIIKDKADYIVTTDTFVDAAIGGTKPPVTNPNEGTSTYDDEILNEE